MLSPARVAVDVTDSTILLTVPQRERRRALVVPREHGASGLSVVPLLTDLLETARLAGPRFAEATSIPPWNTR